MNLDAPPLKTKLLTAPSLAPTLAINGNAIAPMIRHNCKSNIADASRVITDAIDRIKSADPQARIILNMGEKHDLSSHVLLPMGPMDWCVRNGIDTTYAEEQPHNIMVDIAQQGLNLQNILHKDIHLFNDFTDDKGNDILRSLIALARNDNSLQSAEAKWRFCIDNNITTSFTDAAKVSKIDFLDPRDATTLKAMKGSCIFSTDNIHVTSNQGMTIRNKIMSDFAYTSSSDIFVQSTGRDHLFGSNIFPHYQGSLVEQFQSRIDDHTAAHRYQINVYPTFEFWKTVSIPSEARNNTQHMSNTIILDGLSNSRFPKPWYNLSKKTEDDHIKRELKALSLEYSPITIAQKEKWIKRAMKICRDVQHLKTQAPTP